MKHPISSLLLAVALTIGSLISLSSGTPLPGPQGTHPRAPKATTQQRCYTTTTKICQSPVKLENIDQASPPSDASHPDVAGAQPQQPLEEVDEYDDYENSQDSDDPGQQNNGQTNSSSGANLPGATGAQFRNRLNPTTGGYGGYGDPQNHHHPLNGQQNNGQLNPSSGANLPGSVGIAQDPQGHRIRTFEEYEYGYQLIPQQIDQQNNGRTNQSSGANLPGATGAQPRSRLNPTTGTGYGGYGDPQNNHHHVNGQENNGQTNPSSGANLPGATGSQLRNQLNPTAGGYGGYGDPQNHHVNGQPNLSNGADLSSSTNLKSPYGYRRETIGVYRSGWDVPPGGQQKIEQPSLPSDTSSPGAAERQDQPLSETTSDAFDYYDQTNPLDSDQRNNGQTNPSSGASLPGATGAQSRNQLNPKTGGYGGYGDPQNRHVNGQRNNGQLNPSSGANLPGAAGIAQDPQGQRIHTLEEYEYGYRLIPQSIDRPSKPVNGSKGLQASTQSPTSIKNLCAELQDLPNQLHELSELLGRLILLDGRQPKSADDYKTDANICFLVKNMNTTLRPLMDKIKERLAGTENHRTAFTEFIQTLILSAMNTSGGSGPVNSGGNTTSGGSNWDRILSYITRLYHLWTEQDSKANSGLLDTFDVNAIIPNLEESTLVVIANVLEELLKFTQSWLAPSTNDTLPAKSLRSPLCRIFCSGA